MIHYNILACPYCDTLYRRPDQQSSGMILHCRTCGYCLDHGIGDIRKAFIFAITSLILFVIANTAPLITLSMPGSINTVSILSSIGALFANNLHILAIVVFLLTILIPLWYLLGILWVVISFRFAILPNSTRIFLHWINKMTPWSMLEVYLIGIVITLVKMGQIAELSLNTGFWAFSALMISAILSNHYFRLDDAFLQIFTTTQHPPNTSNDYIQCLACGSVISGEPRRCPHCNAHLHRRKQQSVQKTWIYLTTSIILFFPANLLPITYTKSYGQPIQADTIASSIAQLWHYGSYIIAVIVFLASILTPFIKIGILLYLLTHSSPRTPPVFESKLYRFIHIIGRWSMIDVFVVALLGALIQGPFASVNPGIGIFAFAGVVIFTMLATEHFDTRILWDNYRNNLCKRPK